MANPTSNGESPTVDSQTNTKRRRKKSIVWDHFTTERIDADCTKARCMKCKKSFAYISGTKLAGTSHLKRHISLGICPESRNNEKKGQISPCSPLALVDASQEVKDIPRKRQKSTYASSSVSLYQDRCRNDIAKMIIMHDYPLNIVENPAFLNAVKALQPHFTVVPLDVIERECVGLYHRERQTLLNYIGSISGRVNLSIEMCSTNQSIGYAIITGQFIDDDWKLHRRILSVVMLPFPDSDSALNHAVLSCMTDWNLENKLLAVTRDEFRADKDEREHLKNLLSVKNPFFLNSKFLIGSCYARVLCNLAQDALGFLQETVKKVRDSVKYVVTVESCQERFNDLKLQLQVPSAKSLILDDRTQWNSTYFMLVAACELKEVFSCLDTYDPNYQITLTMDEWKQVEILCTFLKPLLDAATLVTGPTYPSANAFFHEAWKIELELKQGSTSTDVFISKLAKLMFERFDRYWEDCFLVFSIAVVMDPRFKMKLVEFSFTRIYGQDADRYIKSVSDGVYDVYLDYYVHMLPAPIFVDNENGGILKNDMNMNEEQETLHNGGIVKTEVPEGEICLDGLSNFEVYIDEITQHNMKEELNQYLEESVLPRMQEFDVLGWWKLNKKGYPILSKMASDVLCIPISTVSQDSVFDITCKKMERSRSSLKPSTVEALVCAKDWLQYGSLDYSPSVSSNSSVKTEF